MKSNDDQHDNRRRVLASVGACDRWALIVAGGCGGCLQDPKSVAANPVRMCPSPDDCLLACAVERATSSVPIGQILIGNAGIASSVQSINQVNRHALVAIVIRHFRGEEDLQYTRKLEGAFAIARQRPDSLILLGVRLGSAELEFAETKVRPDTQENNTERRRPSGLQRKPSLDVALELLAKDAAWQTFVLVGHADALLKLSECTIPEVFAALGKTHQCSGVEAEIVDVARHEVCGVESQTPLLSVGVVRLLVVRIPEFDASQLEDPGRVLCAIEKAGADAVWIAPWTAQ